MAVELGGKLHFIILVISLSGTCLDHQEAPATRSGAFAKKKYNTSSDVCGGIVFEPAFWFLFRLVFFDYLSCAHLDCGMFARPSYTLVAALRRGRRRVRLVYRRSLLRVMTARA